MSCTYHSSVVVGVRLNDLYVVKNEAKTVTKYDENTGQPYQRQETVQRHYWCGTEIDKPGSLYGLVEDRGLFLYTSGDGEEKVVGLRIGDEVEPGDIASFNRPAVEALWDEAADLLRQAGYKGPVQLFVVSFVGC